MNLIIETDIGGDPDDIFALLYLINAGVNIKAIVVSPGHPSQIGLAKLVLSYVGLNIPVGASSKGMISDKKDYSGFYEQFSKLGPINQKADALGYELIEEVMKNDPKVAFFGIGPLKNFGEYILRNPYSCIDSFFMQGGFLGYDCHSDTKVIRLEKFEGMVTCPSFNPNGDKKAFLALVNANIRDRRFISKNICHGVIFDSSRYNDLVGYWENKEITKAYEMFIKACSLYGMETHSKKFHDPTAAVCMLHPEIANWVDGKPYIAKGKCGVDTSQSGSRIASSLDNDRLWEYIYAGE